MSTIATAISPQKRLVRLLTNTIFYTIFGFQLAKLSSFFLPSTYHTVVLGVLAMWFASLSWLSNQPCQPINRTLLYLIQGLTLSGAQYGVIFHGDNTTSMSIALGLSFIGVNTGLLTPWLSHNQPSRDPLTYMFGTLTPLLGIIIGHTMAAQTAVHFPVALIVWPLFMSTVQFRRLVTIEKPGVNIPHKHNFYWLNIGWYWLTVVGYLLTNSLSNPVFYGICFAIGFVAAISFSNWRDESAWETNSAAVWLVLQAMVFMGHEPFSPQHQWYNAVHVILFSALSCKLLIPSISRINHGYSTHAIIGNLAWLLFAFSTYPFVVTHHFLTFIGLVTLFIINSFITDTQSNFLSTTYAVMQFILHRIGVRYSGTENIAYRPKQKVLIVANHSTFLDVPLIASRLHERMAYPIYPFWLDVWFIRVVGGIFADMYPMKPGQSSSLANVIHAIRGGQKCLIFPEGRLTNTGNLMKIFEGAVLIAEHAKADIQPVVINGGMNHFTSRNDFRHIKQFFTSIHVTFGPCTALPETTLKGKAKRKLIKYEIYRRLTETFMHSYPDKTVCEAILDASRQYGKNRLAIQDHDFLNDQTYTGLLQKAKCIAVRLKKEIKSREVLAITVNHGVDTAALLLACFMLEVIALPIDHQISSDAFIKLTQDINIAAIVIDSEAWTELSHSKHYDCLQKLNTTIIEWKPLSQSASYTDKLSMALQPLKVSQSHPETIPALLWYDTESSITTLMSQHNICQQAYQCHISCDLLGHDIVCNSLPLCSSFSVIMGLIQPLISGTTVVLTTREFSEKNTIEIIYDTQSTVLITDLSILSSVDPKHHSSLDTLSLRAIFCNGQPDQETRQRWESITKSYLFSVWTDPNNAGILAINTPRYHENGSHGHWLPCTKVHQNDQEQITALSGPICPDFTYEKSPIAYRKQSSSSWPLHHPATQTIFGFVFTEQEKS